jgi:YfiH family protein
MFVKCPYLSHFPTLKHAFFEYDPTISEKQKVENMAGHPLPLATLKQVHGNKALYVKEATTGQEADGLVTNVKGMTLGIVTADCGPVLFYDPIAEVIGACHAGWRGAKAGIIHATLNAMEEIGAKRSQVYASLGPTIQQKDYEVGPEFPDLIGGNYDKCFKPAKKKDHHYFCLPTYIHDLLLKEKVFEIFDTKVNTFKGPYASRRRIVSQGKEYGKETNFSAIAIV